MQPQARARAFQPKIIKFDPNLAKSGNIEVRKFEESFSNNLFQ